MIVRCLSNRASNLPAAYINPALGYGTDAIIYGLNVGEEYVVYVLMVDGEQTWYYIHEGMYYPHPYPAPFFEVIDPRVSASWRVELLPNGLLTFAFEEWFADPLFFDKLTDQEDEEVRIFQKVKAKMDSEALQGSV